MVWYKRTDKKFKDSEKKSIPDGLWEKCDSCDEILFRPELEKNLSVCHHCQHHFRVSPEIYLDLLIDKGTETQLFSTLESKDFLGFKAGEKYSTQISGARLKTGDLDAIKIYSGTLRKRPIILGFMNFSFIGGSVLLTTCYKTSEKDKTQTANNLVTMIFAAIGGIMSGIILFSLGWDILNYIGSLSELI